METILHQSWNLEIRRAFTAFQLMTILEEALQLIGTIEHDRLLDEHATEMTEYISKRMSDAAKEAGMLLYSLVTAWVHTTASLANLTLAR